MSAESISGSFWQPPVVGKLRPLLGFSLSYLLGCIVCWQLTVETPFYESALSTGAAAGSKSATMLFGSDTTAAATEPVPQTPGSESGTGANGGTISATPHGENGNQVTTIEELHGEWPQWGGTPRRNNVPPGKNIPESWEVGEFDRITGAWDSSAARNVKWVSRLGSQTYGNPVVADGQVYVGTNNGAGHLPRYPDAIDLGCLLCFDDKDGRFLWQHSSEKLPSGRVHDWPLQGICCAPLVEGERLWFVTSRGEVICLDAKGYYDGEDDGPVKDRWANLFREAPLATAGLEQNLVPVPIAALLKKVGVAVSGRVRVDEAGPNIWKLTIRSANASTPDFIRVQSDGNQVILHRLDESSDATETPATKPLISAPVNLLAGIEGGTLNDTMLSLWAARGLPVDSVTRVVPKVAGTSWLAEVSSADSPRTVEIRKEGPNLAAYKLVTPADTNEADEIWVLDMMKEFGVSQHNMCSCSVTAHGDVLFVNTSNGVDESHLIIPNIKAPSFLALDKNTGKLLWSDASPGANILHGQWSSPTVGVVQGVPQVLFAGGDGWLYSFRADAGKDGQPELLWKFDTNPKKTKYVVSGLSTRNHLIATPVIYKDRVYIAVGEDPEHGEGDGHLWCIDPTKRGDISAELAVRVDDRSKIVPPKRLQAVVEEDGEVAIDNPNSGAIWHYSQVDQNNDGETAFEESMHRTIGSVTIKDDLLYIADLSGIFHCLDAMTGEVYWTHDMYSQSWGTPLIVEGRVYIGDEDGEVSVFRLTKERHEPLVVIDMRNSVYSTPIVAHDVMYISNKTHLFAIENQSQEVARRSE